MKKPATFQQGAKQRLDAIEDEWSKKATKAAIDAARDAVRQAGMPDRTRVEGLSETEWGWIVCAAIFAWIKTKGQQAVAEGVGYDEKIRRMRKQNPQPWQAGAVQEALPLFNGLEGVDWSKPLGELSKKEIVNFVWHAYQIVGEALERQAEGSEDKITQFSKDKQERQVSADNGGPLMSLGEMNDDKVPF